MRKFRFRFEAVETVRRSREEQALRALASAQRAHRAEVERKERLVRDLGDAQERRETLGREAVPPSAFATENDFIVGTKVRIIQAEQAIWRAVKGVEKALRAYLTARRQTRTIGVLRERAYVEWRRERVKLENRELDELYVLRSRHAKGSEGRLEIEDPEEATP